MEPGFWEQVEASFYVAVELDDGRREKYLDAVCSNDPSLRRALDSMLDADRGVWPMVDQSVYETASAILQDCETPMDPGERLGHYEIEALIGRGGMGEVYRARDLILDRKVALKLLPSEYSTQPARLRRFRREAKTVSALNHPNILTIYELGIDGDQPFIVTELVEGETLRERMKNGAVDAGGAINIAVQTTRALQAAHAAGITHRDVKPENIMIRHDGLVKVLDFGLAKLSAALDPGPARCGDDDADVSSGMLLGTLRYMSPEQLSGHTADPRSDIYGLGVVLYEMINGTPPFTGKEMGALIESIQNDDPPAFHSPSVPRGLDAVIAKSLSKDPSRRFQTAAEMIAALSGADPNSPRSRLKTFALRRKAWVTAISILLLVVIVAGGRSIYKLVRSGTAAAAADNSRWDEIAPISPARWQAEPATLDGKLYFAGGWSVCKPFANLDEYDPHANTWSRRAPMPIARGGHGAAALLGKLYVVGGSLDCGVHTASVEAYNPTTDSWSELSPLPMGRFGHVVVAASDRIYAIGGRSAGDEKNLTANSEYDPQTNRWTARAPMPTARSGAAAAVVDGIVYVLGGVAGGTVSSIVEAYDPLTDSWTSRRPMMTERSGFAATESNGTIYVFGGTPFNQQVEAYDPKTDAWSVVSTMPVRRSSFHAVSLAGTIYFAGGADGADLSGTAFAFTPKLESREQAANCPAINISPLPPLPTLRGNTTVGAIDGTVYVVGGREDNAGYLSVNEAYDPSARQWHTRTPMPTPRETRGTNTAVVDGKLFVIGGNADGQCSDLNQSYDPKTDLWTNNAKMPTPRCHSASVVLNDLVYVLGGTNTSGSVEYDVVEVYDPRRDTWTTAPPMTTGRQDIGAIVRDGILYAIGGSNPAIRSGSYLDIVEAYDPVANSWSAKSSMAAPRYGFGTGVVGGWIIVAGGGAESATGWVDAYDPPTDTWTHLGSLPDARPFLSSISLNNALYIFGKNQDYAIHGPHATAFVLEILPCS